MASPQFVVREKWQPAQYLLVGSIVVVTLVALTAIGYYIGNRHSLSLIATNEQLVEDLASSVEREENLQKQLVMQEQVNRVEQAANTEAGHSLEAQYQKVRELERELTFYRSILAPEESAKGLQISQFQHSTIDSSRLEWQVSLLQAGSTGSMLSGLATIDLIHLQNGVESRMPLLNKSGNREFGFKFRYFQHLVGEIQMTNDLRPVAFEVTARRYGPNSTPIVRRFEWEQTQEEAVANVE